MALIISGEKIDDSTIQREVERLRPHYEQVFRDKDPQERETQLLDWSRENVIERVLLNRHAKENYPQMPPAEVERAFEAIKKQCGDADRLYMEFGTDNEQEIKEHVELHMRVERMLGEISANVREPSPQEIEKFYEENKEQFESAEQVRVAHIVKHIDWQTDETAARRMIEKAHEELKGGALFETAVAKYSDCPDKGGDLGYITRGEMVEEFEDVVFNLSVNQTSPVFRTRFGFHIARVYDRRPAAVAPLKQVKPRVVSELKEQMRNQTIDEFVDQLKNKADIKEV
ncbi:MAG TPA: peptidylprolyl isomerase [Sedimentisphaerales bacterium]|nr:peptidylprolyl isomerase [Sedimentisphaerales bacterium]